MESEYRKAYQFLYDTYLERRKWLNETDERAGTNAHNMSKEIFEEVIPGVMRRRELKLREDARYLLLLLFVEMIMTPILLNRKFTLNKKVGMNDLRNMIRNDLGRVLREVSFNDEREITGNRILAIIGKLEQTLTLNALKIWG